eukprot:4806774-Lingulodinium_polyedra.AAC.1
MTRGRPWRPGHSQLRSHFGSRLPLSPVLPLQRCFAATKGEVGPFDTVPFPSRAAVGYGGHLPSGPKWL